jgi:hypothetical protein
MRLGYERTEGTMKRTSTAPEHDYDVGYGKPPKANRFRKGQSGNRKGGKRSEENFIAVFKRFATKRVKVNDNGTVKTISMAHAILLRNCQAALKQDETAMGNMLRLAEYVGETQDQHDPKVVGLPLFMPERFESEEEMVAYMGIDIVDVGKQTTE